MWGKGSGRFMTMGHYTIPSGQQINLRLIKNDDTALLVDLFHHLSPQTRRLRFHLYTEKVPEETVWREAIILSNLDPQRHVAVVATIMEADGEEHAVGVARFARTTLEEREAEVAIVVRDDFQRKGVGRILLAKLGEKARELGITHFCGWVMAENLHIMKLIKRLEVQLETELHHGERRVRVAIY
jgi:GNAT superfamily N-acetyltransferase